MTSIFDLVCFYVKNFTTYLLDNIGYRELAVLLLLGLLIITGCSSTAPTVRVVTQKVNIPVIVPCIQEQDIPVYSDYVKTKINRSDEGYTKVRKLIIRDFEHQKFAKVVEATMKGCSE